MKFHKVILLLALTALIIIFNGAESQLFPPITPTPTRPSPPPTTPPPPPPPPPKTPKSTPTTGTTSTTDPFFPPPSSQPILPPSSSLPPVSPLPSLPPSPSIPLVSPPLTPSVSIPPSTPSTPQTPSSPAANPFDCSVLLSCSNPKMYCDIPAGKCRAKKNLGDQCNNDNECSSPFVCRENTCGYSDVETANARHKNSNDNYNVKKVAIFGAIIVGASGICGLVFFVIRYLKKKRDYDIASRLYSTDDDMSDADPYPFAERSNSFSKNTSQPPRAPTTNRYDNLPPTGNRAFAPRPGYQNYYNKYNEGMYMRQNMPNEETRTMNLLQQTRGNVMVTPQQNYNWNMRMNQGGLFPIPTVNVIPSPNNMNNVVLPPPNNIKKVPSSNNLNNAVSLSKNTNKSNNTRNINNINSPGEDDDSKNDHVAKTLRYSVDYTNDQNNHQTKKSKVVRRDSNTLSSDDVKEAQSNPKDSKASKERNGIQSTYNPSILDSYARESIFTKTLETKLSQSSMKFNNNADDSNTPTIRQNISRAQLVVE